MAYGYSCRVLRADGVPSPRNEDFSGGLFIFSVLRRWKSSRNPKKNSVTRFIKLTSKRFDEFERFKKSHCGILSSSLENVESHFRIRIFIWTKSNKKSAPKCVRKSVQSTDFCDLHFLSERHGKEYLRGDLRLIYYVDEFLAGPLGNGQKKQKANIFEAVALINGETADQFMRYRKLWGHNDVFLKDANLFADKFDLGLELWEMRMEPEIHFYFGKRLFNYFANRRFILLVNDTWDKNSEKVSINDHTTLVYDPTILKYYPCTYPECPYEFNRKSQLDRHLKSHKTEPTRCIETQYGGLPQIMSIMKQEALLHHDFKEEFAMFWDIECLPISLHNRRIHVPISIAVSRNFGFEREFVLIRNNMQPEGLKTLISDFCDLLEKSYEEFIRSFSFEFWKNRKKVKNQVALIRSEKSKLNVEDRATVFKIWDQFSRILKLKIFAFRGERYDVPVLKASLFDEFLRRDSEFQALTRGCGVMEFRFKNIIGRDVANFAPPTSLKRFAKSLNIKNVQKDLWPYTFYSSIQEIKDATTFPPIHVFEPQKNTDFITEFYIVAIKLNFDHDDVDPLEWFGIPDEFFENSDIDDFNENDKKTLATYLKVSPEDYYQAKMRFLEKLASGEWCSMLDQLKFYNIIDVKLLQEIWRRYSDHFYWKFGVDVQDHMSLSQCAQTILYKNFPRFASPIVTFSEDYGWINRDIRKNLVGGLACCFTRHAQTFPDSKYPKSVYTAPNGDQLKYIIQEDVNSLYPTVMRYELPVGSGILYSKSESGFFTPEILKKNDGSNPSEISKLWLDFMLKDFRKINKKVEIQSAFNGFERKIGKFKLDGFCILNDKTVGLDFFGCFYHFCDKCSLTGQRKTSRKDHFDRINYLKRHLDSYIYVSECEFRKKLTNSSFEPEALMLRKNIDDEEILSMVLNGTFYGLLKVDIVTPENAQKKFLDLNHPPIFRHISVEHEMIHENFKSFAKEKYRKFPLHQQLGLTFHATEIILVSPLLRFYLQNGLKVTKIYYFLQFSPEKCFKPYIDKLVKMRIEATDEKDDQKQMLAKLMMNSSWGRMAMNVKDRKKTTYLREQSLESHNSLLMESVCPLFTEYPIDLLEIKKNRTGVNDRVPVHTALFILQLSKLHMLEYLSFLYRVLEPGCMKLLYSDTDSLCYAISGQKEHLIKEDQRSYFEREKYNWYIKDNSAIELRTPGKLKPEFSSNNAVFFGISPKCYCLHNFDEDLTKKAHKGANSSKMTVKNYEAAVYNLENDLCDVREHFIYHKQTSTMQSVRIKKKLMHNFYTKFQLQPDLVTLLPLRKDGALI